ncbi:hypothetical protein CWO89_26210 [Bradyrhizobium sp. Leo170]|nr:hypothetical protein CWO89_26210 [Bradyrhizobium sp. Leo170]
MRLRQSFTDVYQDVVAAVSHRRSIKDCTVRADGILKAERLTFSALLSSKDHCLRSSARSISKILIQ